MGVLEYWQFDPKSEWITEQLRGYRLAEDAYRPITDGVSQVLGLRLTAANTLIEFYKLETGEKLLIPEELKERADQEAQRADKAEAELETLKAKLKAKGIELDN